MKTASKRAVSMGNRPRQSYTVSASLLRECCELWQLEALDKALAGDFDEADRLDAESERMAARAEEMGC